VIETKSEFFNRICAHRTARIDVNRTYRTVALGVSVGGKRAYSCILGKDRSPRHSRHSIASADWHFTAWSGLQFLLDRKVASGTIMMEIRLK
jgi:hypothetical protein